jgi:paraquat-inducible protein B
VSSIAKKLDRVPFDAIGSDLQKALVAVDQTLRDSRALLQRLDAESVAEFNRTLLEAQQTLKSVQDTIAPESPLQMDLREALREMARATASMRRLAEHLQRQPQSVIRGKPDEDETE